MTVAEYNAMMEAKGTAKVWIVDYSVSCPGLVRSKLFKSEDDAKDFAKNCGHVLSIRRTWDIWNMV